MYTWGQYMYRCVYMCARVHVCAQVHICLCTCVYRGQRSTSGLVPQKHLPLFSETVSHWGWLTSKLQGSSCFHPTPQHWHECVPPCQDFDVSVKIQLRLPPCSSGNHFTNCSSSQPCNCVCSAQCSFPNTSWGSPYLILSQQPGRMVLLQSSCYRWENQMTKQ